MILILQSIAEHPCWLLRQWLIMLTVTPGQPGSATDIKNDTFELKTYLMKRKILAGLLFLFIALGFSACEALSDCETCRIVTKNSSGTVTDSGVEAEYCGATLIAFKAANPTVTDPVTGSVTTLECN